MSYAGIDLDLQPRRRNLILTTKPALVIINYYSWRLSGVSICWAAAEASTQFTIFDLSVLKKQTLIILFLEVRRIITYK